MSKRPCDHADADPSPTCAVCRRYATNDAYNRRHGGQGIGTPPTACVHLGAETRRQQCGTCAGKVELKVFACQVHGECTAAKPAPGVKGCCQGCADHRPQNTIPNVVRNLIYHVYPRSANGVWQRNVGQLLRRIRLFNGRRVVAIATGPGCDPAEHVRDAFGGHVHEFVETPNDPHLREVVTFASLMERVESTNAAHVTFYGQAKGVTRPVNPGVSVHPWADILYETCLDYWPLVESTLARFPTAGSLKKVGAGFGGSASSFHYSGTFFWFRCRDVFAKNWRHIDRQWWGVEAWPGLHFGPHEAGLLFHQGVCPTLDLYSMNYLNSVVRPELERWRAENAASRKEWAPC